MTMKITISIIVCTLHNVEGLEKLIVSINQQTLKPNELIIVHGDANKKTEENIRKKIIPIIQSKLMTFKYIKTVRSLVIQRNIGIDNAFGDIIIFLDDDVILEREYLFYLLEAYKLKWAKDLGGVQGTIIEKNKNNNLWQAKEFLKKIFLLGGCVTGKGCLLPSVNASFCRNPKTIKKVEIFNGCMMSFKREILLKNRFDYNFKELWACDDIELSYRISQQYQLYQTPFAQLHHVQSSLGYEGHKKIARMLVFNRFYVFRLYFSNLKKNWILFLWSNLGELCYRMVLCIKTGDIGPVLGFFEGWKMIFASKCHPYRKIN